MKKFILPTALLVLTLANSRSAELSRRGKVEVFGLAQYNGGDSTTASGSAGQIKVDSFVTGGIGMGYHFLDHLSLALDLSFGSATVKGAVPSVVVQTDSFATLADVSLEYNILKTRFTPVLAGGIGFINYTGDFGTTTSSFQETDLTYGAGGGLRWDITDHLALKLLYRASFTKMQDTADTMLFHTVTLSAGYAF